jgi:diguanylate cyclase (GGDEF)-like protein
MQMVPVVRVIRRGLRATIAPVLATALVLFSGPRPVRFVVFAAVALAALVVVAMRSLKRHQQRLKDLRIARLDASSALLLLATSFVAINLSGGVQRSALLALPVLFLAVLGALTAPGTAVLMALAALAMDTALSKHAGSWTWANTALRGALFVAATLSHMLLTRREVAKVRKVAAETLAAERSRQKESAKSFRLITAPSAAPHQNSAEDARRVRSGLEEIRENTLGLLTLAKQTMGLHTCGLYWLDSKGTQLELVAVCSDNERSIMRSSIAVGTGAVGGAVAMGKTVVLSKLRPEYSGLSYYEPRMPTEVRNFAGVPVTEEGEVRGVLVADRAGDRSFEALDQAALEALSTQCLRLVRTERVFAAMEKSKDELAKMHAASRALGDALSVEQVLDAVAQSAEAFVAHDLCVVTSYDPKTLEHKVRFAKGEHAEALKSLQFASNHGIASSVVESRHALPYRGQYDARAQFLFTKDVALEGLESAICLPLVVRDHPIGTLTLAAQRKSAFSDTTRGLLALLAGNAAVALSNASAVRRLEELAITDPMTGLLNKRALELEFEKRIKSAARFGRKLSVLVTDVDKFKNVNDTYGHAVGDVVIKGLGAIMTKCKRDTDAVARFGGEEFVLVCEETDLEGAYALAERIRTELEATTFATEMGPVKVTCSLGVAEFPADGETRETLFSKADAALYDAKRSGRNRTCVAGGVLPVGRATPVIGQAKRSVKRTTDAPKDRPRAEGA